MLHYGALKNEIETVNINHMKYEYVEMFVKLLKCIMVKIM